MKEKKIDTEIVERQPLSEESNLKKELIDFGKLVAMCVISMYILLNFIARPLIVSGLSMYPTLDNGSINIYNRFSAKFLDIDYGDVVVAHYDDEDVDIVKRVVALPGDTVSYEYGVLRVNGEIVEEDYVILSMDHYREDWDFKTKTLGDDEYWLMGDNRNHSVDSRVIGAFHRDDIIGNGVLTIFPFSSIGVVD